MNERSPAHDTSGNEPAPTIELSTNESFQVAPHNTALFEFTAQAASRNHIFFYAATSSGDLASLYLFRTFDPETYDSLRQHILADPTYEVTLADEVNPPEEHAYQQQIDQRVASWRLHIPDTVLDFLITTAR